MMGGLLALTRREYRLSPKLHQLMTWSTTDESPIYSTQSTFTDGRATQVDLGGHRRKFRLPPGSPTELLLHGITQSIKGLHF